MDERVVELLGKILFELKEINAKQDKMLVVGKETLNKFEKI